MRELEQPLNATERFLHAIAVRLDVVIDLLTEEEEVEDEIEEVEESVIEEVEEVEEEEEIDYSEYTVAELKGFLDDKKISYTSTMRKADLIELLK